MTDNKNLVENENVVVNNNNNKEMKQEVTYKTVKANINGTVENIILGYSTYNMERPKDKADLISLIDKEKMLDVIFHLGNADIFWNEEIELKDANGNIIPKDTPNVYVPCDTADTYWRFEVDEILQNVEIHKFNSLQEYGQAIGNTTLYSRKPNNVESLGFASIASKNQTYNSIYNFAKKHGIPMNTAMSFFDVKLKQTQTMQLAMGLKVKDIPELKRTEEEAEELIESVEMVFGKQDNVSVICAYVDGEDDVSTRIKGFIDSIAPDDSWIIFTDLFGGSVNNEFMKYISNPQIRLIAGMNLALVITAMSISEMKNNAAEVEEELLGIADSVINFCSRTGIDSLEDDEF